jgi:ATP-binding cassette subfamily B protein
MQEDVLGKAYDARLMRRLVGYLGAHKGAVAIAFVAIVGGSLVELAQPWITQQAIDRYIGLATRPGSGGWPRLLLLAIVSAFAFEYLQTFVLQSVGQRIMHTVRMEVYTHLQRLDVSFYDKNPVGRLMTRVTTDVDALNDMFASGVVTVFGDVLVLFGIMAAMLLMNWRLALVAFAVLPLIAWVTAWFRKNVRESYRHVRGLIARVNAFLQEHLTGMPTIQLFVQEARTFHRFDAINRAHRDVNIASIFFYAVFYPVIEILAALSSALIIWVGGGWALEGVVTIGVLVAFLDSGGSSSRSRPLREVQHLPGRDGGLERIFTLLDTPVVIGSATGVEAWRPGGWSTNVQPCPRLHAPSLHAQASDCLRSRLVR